jgi:hypothetical protein
LREIYNNYKSFYGAYSKEEHGSDATYEDKLFYLKQENGNTELIQTDLNGNNEKVLKQYADCYELVAYTDSTYIFSIMVCEDKVVVMYEDQESNPKYDVVGY